jgi:hypothetical protein
MAALFEVPQKSFANFVSSHLSVASGQSSVVSGQWSVHNFRVTRRLLTDSSLACCVWLNETDLIEAAAGVYFIQRLPGLHEKRHALSR